MRCIGLIAIDETMLYLAAFWFAAIIYVVASWTNPYWRCKRLRQLTKKNYMGLCMIQKDARNISLRIINADSDVIILGTKMWVALKERVMRRGYETTQYRFAPVVEEPEGKTVGVANIEVPPQNWLQRLNPFRKKETMKLDYDKTKGFVIKESSIRFEEGIPCVYVDSDSWLPYDFKPERADVRSEEAGATLLGWVRAEILKGAKNREQIQLFLMLCLIFSFVAAAASVIQFINADAPPSWAVAMQNELHQIKNKTDAIRNYAVLLPLEALIA